jgi:hypothetical protein
MKYARVISLSVQIMQMRRLCDSVKAAAAVTGLDDQRQSLLNPPYLYASTYIRTHMDKRTYILQVSSLFGGANWNSSV